MKFKKMTKESSKKPNKLGLKKMMASFLAGCMTMGSLGDISLFPESVNSILSNEVEVYANTNTTTPTYYGHWSDPYMQNLYNRGLISGDTNGNLNPEKDITRAEFVAIANRAFGYDSPGANPFSDITGTEWYARDITIAYNQGYFNGISDNESGAALELTREQAISLIARNLNLSETYKDDSKFADSKQISTWSVGVVNTATDKGYLTGYEDGTFRPQGNITRGEVAKVLTEALGHLIDEPTTQSLGYIKGNVTISSSGVTLQDTVIDGDLFITPGAGTGFTVLNSVVVLGEVIVSGTGVSNASDSSVKIIDSSISQLTVAGGTNTSKTISTEGQTYIETTYIKSNAYLEELDYKNNGFTNIILDGDPYTTLHLNGVFDNVTIYGEQNILYLADGVIDVLVVDEDAVDSKVQLLPDTYVGEVYLDTATSITGQGEIGYAKVNVDNCVIEMIPDLIEVKPGVTATVAGQVVDSVGAAALSSGPRIETGYPTVEPITGTGGTANVKANKAGTLSWAITLETDGPATATELEKLDPLNYNLMKSGTIAIGLGEEKAIAITGLQKNIEYIFTVMLTDEKGVQSSVRYRNFTTADDTTSSFVTGFPLILEISSDFMTFEVITQRSSDLHWAVYSPDMPAPTALAMRNNDIAESIVNNCGDSDKWLEKLTRTEYLVEELEDVTDYVLYTMLADGNNMSPVIATKFTTIDTTPPVIVDVDYETGSKSLDVGVKVDETAFYYYAVYLDSVEFPFQSDEYYTSDAYDPENENDMFEIVTLNSDEGKSQVMEAKSAVEGGNTKNVASLVESTVSLKNLDSTKAYTMYILAQDVYGNLSDVYVKELPIRPALMDDYPIVNFYPTDAGKIDGRTPAKNQFRAIKEGDVYWVVYEGSKAVAPTQDELMNIALLQPPTESVSRGVTSIDAKNVAYESDWLTQYDDNFDIDDPDLSPYNGLKELTTYTLYALIKDKEANGVQYSDVYKYQFTVPDSTKPVVSAQFTQSLATSIEVSTLADEAVTFYYALAYSGTQLIIPQEDYVTPESDDLYVGMPYFSDLWSEDWVVEKIMSGYNSKKSGSSNLKANTSTSLRITGLEAETVYDIYYVAIDSSGNRSDVQLLEKVSTLDVSPPEVSLEFTVEDLSGMPTTETGIRVQFDEQVQGYYRNPQTGITTSVSLAEALLNGELYGTDNYIQLFRIMADGTHEQVPINDGVALSVNTISSASARTYTEIYFPAGAFDLISDGDYYFLVYNITDMADPTNEIIYSKVDLSFKTEPPTINFLNLNKSTGNYHYTFKFTPQNIDVGEDKYFDAIISSSAIVSLNLHKVKADGSYQLIGENLVISAANQYYGFSDFQVPEDIVNELFYQDNSLYPEGSEYYGRIKAGDKYGASILDGFSGSNTINTYGEIVGFHGTDEFAIEVVTVNNKPIEDGVESDLKLSIFGVMGPESSVNGVAGTAQTVFDPSPYDGLSIVSFVTANRDDANTKHLLEMTYNFRDDVAPQFINNTPIVTPYATTVGSYAISDKDADLYYVLFPRTQDPNTGEYISTPYIAQFKYPDVNGDGKLTKEEDNLTDEEWAIVEYYGEYDFLSSHKNTIMSYGTSFVMGDAQTVVTTVMADMPDNSYVGSDLTPATTTVVNGVEIVEGAIYDLFAFLKGAADETSIVYYEEIETTEPDPPTMYIDILSTGSKTVTARFMTDKPAVVYYAIHREQQVASTKPEEGLYTDLTYVMTTVGDNSQVGIVTLTADDINANNSAEKRYEVVVTIEGLAQEIVHNLRGASTVPGSDLFSEIVIVSDVTTIDDVPPTVTLGGADPTYKDDGTFSGTLTLEFSEALYTNPIEKTPLVLSDFYSPTNFLSFGATRDDITSDLPTSIAAAAMSLIEDTEAKSMRVVLSDYEYDRVASTIVEYNYDGDTGILTVDETDVSRGIKTLNITYSNVQNGHMMAFIDSVYDVYGNNGKLFSAYFEAGGTTWDGKPTGEWILRINPDPSNWEEAIYMYETGTHPKQQ